MRKQQTGGLGGPKPFNAIEEFCERFDKAVKNTMAQVKHTDLKFLLHF